MSATSRRLAALVALCGTVCLCNAAMGETDGGAASGATTPAAAVGDEIIVRGRIGQLRLEMRLAEEAVYTRFNDINSDDRFDIHCYWEAGGGSRIHRRFCLSNSWREQNANFAQATVRAMQGEYGINAQQYLGQQLLMQRRLHDEMLRLAAEDDPLAEAVWRLARAQLALAGETGLPTSWTVSQPVSAGADGLPFDAERMFEVKIGRAPWSHRLLNPTFTIGRVTGHIRKLSVDCDQGSERIDYEAGLDWTLPNGWSGCTLQVGAKPDTTFALYEFD